MKDLFRDGVNQLNRELALTGSLPQDPTGRFCERGMGHSLSAASGPTRDKQIAKGDLRAWDAAEDVRPNDAAAAL